MSAFSNMLVQSKEPDFPPVPHNRYDSKITELYARDPDRDKYLLPIVGATVVAAAALAYKLIRHNSEHDI